MRTSKDSDYKVAFPLLARDSCSIEAVDNWGARCGSLHPPADMSIQWLVPVIVVEIVANAADGQAADLRIEFGGNFLDLPEDLAHRAGLSAPLQMWQRIAISPAQSAGPT